MTACLAWAGGSVAQPITGEATITGFSIPEVDDSGALKWKVLGDSARFKPTGGPIDITQVRMELYKDSKVDMVLTSRQCFFDREKREAQTDAPVEITGRNLTITGNGFFWSGPDNLLVIRNNARVVLNNVQPLATASTNDVSETPSTQEAGQ
jgi:hypothetical protein